MNIKLSVLTLAAAGMSLTGCDKDPGSVNVDPAVNNAFHSMYNGATRAQWEHKQGFYVVDFWQNGVEAEAWYDSTGAWYMTETDVRYADLPEAVRGAFAASEWAGWRVDDVDKLEYPDRETVYVIEIELADVDRALWFSPDGVLAKVVPDNNTGIGTGTGNGTDPGTNPGNNPGNNPGTNPGNGSNTGTGGYGPSTILPAAKDFIAQKYPGARIIDVETERNSIEIDIVDGRTPREVIFSLDGAWIHTETEMRRADVPAQVLDALAASQWGAWRIDDISLYETPAGLYYLIEVESGNRESYVKIDTNGNLI